MALEYCDGGTPGDGLLAGHAYSVLDILEVHADATAQFDALDVRMVKVGSWGKPRFNRNVTTSHTFGNLTGH